jgi:hypothetical protein
MRQQEWKRQEAAAVPAAAVAEEGGKGCWFGFGWMWGRGSSGKKMDWLSALLAFPLLDVIVRRCDFQGMMTRKKEWPLLTNGVSGLLLHVSEA